MTPDTASQVASFSFVVRIADDNLVIAHRLSEWSSHAHDLEDDIALTNIALDHLGQARGLLTYAGEVEGRARTEDALAYHRDEREFLNCLLVEQPNGDFAHTIVRQLLWSCFQNLLWDALVHSSDSTVSAIAAKALKEARYHLEYATTWTLRLGDGTAESHARMGSALTALWRYTDELFEMDDVAIGMVQQGVGPDLSALRKPWRDRIEAILREATLQVPDDPYQQSGGRTGMHSAEFGFLIAEMQHLPRSMPEAIW